MYRSKQELDTKIQDIFSKLSEDEKRRRCLKYARLYLGLREHDTALDYLNDYVSVPGLPEQHKAHDLIGGIYEQRGKQEEALKHYKRSYELYKSRDVLNKVCSLLQNGYGKDETPQSKMEWQLLQKATSPANDMIDLKPKLPPKPLATPMSNTTPLRSSHILNTSNSSDLFSKGSLGAHKSVGGFRKQESPGDETVSGEASYLVKTSTPIRKPPNESHRALDFNLDAEDTEMLDTLNEIMQQNASFKNELSQASDEIKDLHLRIDNLKISKRVIVRNSRKNP